MHFVRSCVGLFTPSCKIFWDVGYSSDKLSVRPFNSLLKPSPDFRFSFKFAMLITKFCSGLLSVFRNEMDFFGNTTLNQAYFPALSLQRKFDKQSSSTTCYNDSLTIMFIVDVFNVHSLMSIMNFIEKFHIFFNFHIF